MHKSGRGIGVMASLCVVILLAAGCATRVGDFPVISTKKPDYRSIDEARVVQNIQAEDSRLWFLCFPLGGPPTIADAVDACLKKGNGDFMTEAKLYTKNWTVILFSYGAYQVEGSVGDSRSTLIEK